MIRLDSNLDAAGSKSCFHLTSRRASLRWDFRPQIDLASSLWGLRFSEAKAARRPRPRGPIAVVWTMAKSLDVHLALAWATGLRDEAGDLSVLAYWAVVTILLDVDVAHGC